MKTINNYKSILVILACACLFSGMGYSQIALPSPASDWKVSGEVRARYAYKHRGNGASANSDFLASGVDNVNDYLFLRTTLGIAYQPEDAWLSGFFQLRDNRVWDDDRSKSPVDKAIDLYQAYVVLGNLKKDSWQLKLGRQEAGFGSYIIIGIPNYKTGKSFDAGRFTYQREKLTAELFAGRVVNGNQGSFNDDSKHNEWLSGVSVTLRDFPKRVTTQLYGFSKNANEDASGGDRDIYSVGAYFKSNAKDWSNWHWSAEGVYQFGTIGTGSSELDHQSYLIHLALGYTFDCSWKPKFTLEYYYSPGDSDASDGKSETFDIMYAGKNHPRGGYTDVVGWRNTQMLHLGLQMKPKKIKGLKMFGSYWNYWLSDTSDYFYAQGGSTGRNQNGFGRNPEYGSYLGSELSAGVQYVWKKTWSAKVEYGHFFVGEYIKQSLADTGGASDIDSLTVTMGYKF